MAAFQCLQPFIGTALAYLYLGEHPTWWSLGAAGVLAGLVLVIRAPREGGALGAGCDWRAFAQNGKAQGARRALAPAAEHPGA